MSTASELHARGSVNANEWAQKRREQIERAKVIKDERKTGQTNSSNALQGAGAEFLRGGVNNGRSQQQTPISYQNLNSDNISSPIAYQYSQGYPPQTNSTPNGYRHYTGHSQEYLNDHQQRSNSYINQQQQYAKYPASQQNYSNFSQSPNVQNFDDSGRRANGIYQNVQVQPAPRTQDNYYQGQQYQFNKNSPIQYGQQQQIGVGLGVQSQLAQMYGPQGQHNTIQYENSMQRLGQHAHQRQNISQPIIQQHPQKHVNQMEHDTRNPFGATGYSSQEANDAKGSLQLLKMRLSSRDQQAGAHTTQDTDNSSYPQSQGYSQQQSYAAAKPPRNQKQIDADSESANRNYRKVFKPDQASVENVNDVVLNGGRKQIQKISESQNYQPERKEIPQRQGVNKVVKQPNSVDLNVHQGPNYGRQPQRAPQYANDYESQNQYRQVEPKKQQSLSQPPKQQPLRQPARQQMSEYPTYDAPAYAGGNQNNNQPEEYGEVGRLIECGDCGRKFNEQAIIKHRKICKKVFVEKRKTFDITEHRKATDASGKGIEEDPYSRKQKQKPKAPPPKQQEMAGGKLPKWKLQSMQLRQGLGAVSGKANNDISAAQIAQYQEDTDDRILCRFCGRKFNENAGQRHIAFCEQKSKKEQFKSGPIQKRR